MKIETNKPNQWITLTYKGNVNKTRKNNHKNIKIVHKTNNKVNNLISNKIGQFNKCDWKGIYKLTCTSCNKFYIGRTNRNFNTRFTEHRKVFNMKKANPNFLIMSLGKDMKSKQ